MTDEEIIGKEFEAVEFKGDGVLIYDYTHKNLKGKIGIVTRIHYSLPYCRVKFKPSIGKILEHSYPLDVVKQQIDERTPIDIDQLFKDIRGL